VNSFFTLEFVHFLRALHFGPNAAYKSILTQYFKIYVLYYLCAARLELAVTFCFVASQLSHRQSPCYVCFIVFLSNMLHEKIEFVQRSKTQRLSVRASKENK
jgi:hypothetical protein